MRIASAFLKLAVPARASLVVTEPDDDQVCDGMISVVWPPART